jgi:adenylosuccinate synthase
MASSTSTTERRFRTSGVGVGVAAGRAERVAWLELSCEKDKDAVKDNKRIAIKK